MRAVYQASATSSGDGRMGHVRSGDGLLDLELAVPKEMGGPGDASNPEQLFAAGYAACFHSALRGVAGGEGVTVTDSTVTVEVGIGKDGQGGYRLDVSIEASLPGIAEDKANELVEKAHRVCPYSNATRGNIDVSLSLA